MSRRVAIDHRGAPTPTESGRAPGLGAGAECGEEAEGFLPIGAESTEGFLGESSGRGCNERRDPSLPFASLRVTLGMTEKSK
jgi:hypothetical protein